MGSPNSRLTLFDCICLIVGVIIGSGIYGTTPFITSNAGSQMMAIQVWLLGGALILNGLLCYAELVTKFPRRGGDYAFLNLAYGNWLGFLFAWTEFWIIRPANIGAMAFVYGQYAHQWTESQGFSIGGEQPVLRHALVAVLSLSAINLAGFRSGKITQNVLTTLKVVGLALLLAVAFLSPVTNEATATKAEGFSASGFQLALILVLFTYGGGNDVSYVAAEVKDPRRNLPRALAVGVGLVISLYLLVNFAFFRVLGYDGVVGSSAVAADAMRACVGPWGASAMSLLVCVSCLGAISAMIFTGARIYHAMGVDHPVVGWLGRWSDRGVPYVSVLAQAVVMYGMIVLVGRDDGGFEPLVVYAAPFFWSFFSLVAACILIFRFRNEKVDAIEGTVYSAPLYPLGPLLFLASCLFLLYASAKYLYASQLAADGWSFRSYWSLGVLASGLLIGLLSRPRASRSDEKPKLDDGGPSALSQVD